MIPFGASTESFRLVTHPSLTAAALALASFPVSAVGMDVTTSGGSPLRTVDHTSNTPALAHILSEAAHVSSVEHLSTAEAMLELRRLSGLTWEELASLLSVSRRALHSWANGARLSSGNEHKLRRALAVVRANYRGSAADVRDYLLQPSEEGQLTLQKLAADLTTGRSFERWFGAGSPPSFIERPELSDEEQARRLPWRSVADQLSIIDDAHLPGGKRSRIAKTFRK